MKTTTYFTSFILASFLLCIFSGCTKEEDPPSACCDCLKPATQTGRGTMSMKIDGRTWSNCNPLNPKFKTVGVYIEQSQFSISGYRNYENGQSNENFHLVLKNPLKEGEYMGPIHNYVFRLFFRDSPIYGSGEYATDKSKPLHLNITRYDETNRIVSGSFDCWMIKQWGKKLPDSVHITEGRFDTKF